jgi:hypothetical protein
MDKKREEVYGFGIVFLVLLILLSIFTGSQIINSGWNMSTWVLVVIAGVCGVFGIGSLLKPDSFGAIILRLIENYAKSQERGSSDSHNKQTQKESDGSVQVMGDRQQVNISVPQKSSTEEKELPPRSRVFSCPNGHKYIAYPPDDNHLTASLEKDQAEKNAIGTVIPRCYTCKDCGRQSTLYWYHSGYVFFGKTPKTRR